MRWFDWVIFCLRLVIEFGPALVKLGREIYRKVEEATSSSSASAKVACAGEPRVSRSEKRLMFDQLARKVWVEEKQAMPGSEAIVSFREKIWRRENGPDAKRKGSDELPAGLVAKLEPKSFA